jgi:hypothetical protein
MMSLQQIRRDIEGLKESTTARPLQTLLNCNADDLLDAELTKLLTEVPLRQLPTSVLLTIQNRKYGTNFKSIQDIPDGYCEKMSLQQIKKELVGIRETLKPGMLLFMILKREYPKNF